MAEDFDVIVVGAGPAGSMAALAAARGGWSVCLIERGPFPGSKNMYGGVVYPRILDQVIDRWWEDVPVQRFITRRQTMVMESDRALTVDYRTAAWGAPPYNGLTTYRSDFDRWLATKATEAGATLVCSTTVTGLLLEHDRVVGVRTDRPEGELRAKVVIACDGVNSFLAKEAGLYANFSADHLTLGVKEVLRFDPATIEERFGVTGREGCDIEILGATPGVLGGGFCYTNYDTVAIGIIAKLPSLAAAKVRPEDLIANLKAHPAIEPLVRGGELVEYNAHMIPEGGLKAMPQVVTDGMVVCGDAAHLTLAAGIWLEGVNFAMGSGLAAGEAAAEAISAGDWTAAGLGVYRTKINSTFVLKDHEKLQHIPELVLSERVQFAYPALICDLVEELFTVRNPTPKPGGIKVLLDKARANDVKLRHLAIDGLKALRSFR